MRLCDPDITLDMNLKHPELIGYRISEDNFLPIIGEYCKES